MKITTRFLMIFIIACIAWASGRGFAKDFNLNRVGHWGTGSYNDVAVNGRYAYCAVAENGLEIIDIQDQRKPVKVGAYEIDNGYFSVYVKDSYAYVTCRDELHVIDVSNPRAPQKTGDCLQLKGRRLRKIIGCGNLIYVSTDSGVEILDISAPSNPVPVSRIADEPIYAFFAKDSMLYLGSGSDLQVYDVSKPSEPVLLWEIRQIGISLSAIYASGDRVCVAGSYYDFDVWRLRSKVFIIDVSNPSVPDFSGTYLMGGSVWDLIMVGDVVYATDCDYDYDRGVKCIDFSNFHSPKLWSSWSGGQTYSIFLLGNRLFTAAVLDGLRILDVSDPSALNQVGGLDHSGVGYDVFLKGNLAYLSGDGYGLQVIDVTDKTAPLRIGVYEDKEEKNYMSVFVKDNYAYLAQYLHGMTILDISNPASPVPVGLYKISNGVMCVHVSGDYAYVGSNYGFRVVNVSDPAKPAEVAASYDHIKIRRLDVKDNWVYLAAENGLIVLDVSNPASPVETARFSREDYGRCNGVKVKGDFVYCTFSRGVFLVFHSGSGSTLRLVGRFASWGPLPWVKMNSLDIEGSLAYVADNNYGVTVLDISDPSSPVPVGNVNIRGDGVCAHNGFAYISSVYTGKLSVLQYSHSMSPPLLTAEKDALYFRTVLPGSTGSAQTVSLRASGGDDINWTAAMLYDSDWLSLSPVSGKNGGAVTAAVVEGMVSKPGIYTDYINMTSPEAYNSPLLVKVVYEVVVGGQSSPPFGQFSTPPDGAAVSGSIPVTGWALDDVGVAGVQIFRGEVGELHYLGDAVLVEGARPDVELTFPGYPGNSRAGWGYMLLTNYLPNGGNGTFKLHALAADVEGNLVSLGCKTIVCDNANAVKPFGAIDTPEQGGLASGSQYLNFGWVLTPMPNTVPFDGSTIKVWIDGVHVGNPVYNQFREDLAVLFPGYNNSNGAVGYFYLDTTEYENGVHTIQWTAEDDAHNTDGIGSRYFTVMNPAQRTEKIHGSAPDKYWSRGADISEVPYDYSGSITVCKGYDHRRTETLFPDEHGEHSAYYISIEELQRMQIRLDGSGPGDQLPLASNVSYSGYMMVGNQLRALPIGCSLDRSRGIFSWLPGPGFVGEYRLVFIKNVSGHEVRKDVTVRIVPRLEALFSGE